MVVIGFDFKRVFGEPEGLEGVYHYCEFEGFFCSDAFLYCAGMGTVWNAAGMQGYLSFYDTFAGHEIAINIVEHFVGIYVGVVVGRRDGLWMIIEEARAE